MDALILPSQDRRSFRALLVPHTVGERHMFLLLERYLGSVAVGIGIGIGIGIEIVFACFWLVLLDAGC